MPAWPGFAVYRTSFFNRQSRLTHKEHTGTSGANLEHKPPAGTSYAGQVKPIRKYLEGNQCTLHFITSCRLVHTLNLLVKFAAKHIAGLYMLYTEQLNSFLSIFFFFFFFFCGWVNRITAEVGILSGVTLLKCQKCVRASTALVFVAAKPFLHHVTCTSLYGKHGSSRTCSQIYLILSYHILHVLIFLSIATIRVGFFAMSRVLPVAFVLPVHEL